MRAGRSRERSDRRGGPAEALLGERALARRGGGPEAETTAGNMQQTGERYFLLKKN